MASVFRYSALKSTSPVIRQNGFLHPTTMPRQPIRYNGWIHGGRLQSSPYMVPAIPRLSLAVQRPQLGLGKPVISKDKILEEIQKEMQFLGKGKGRSKKRSVKKRSVKRHRKVRFGGVVQAL
jgi:hypothetical protein